MAVDIAEIVLRLIEDYGLAALLFLLILDGALLLPVFPGEVMLVMVVSAYATDIPTLLGLIVLTSLAVMVGCVLLYGIVRAGGRRLVERFPRFFMMPPKRRERLEAVFQKPAGQSLVMFLRLFPLTRILVNIPAGLAKMPFGRFLMLSSIGILLYHATFMWFAYEVNRPGSTLATQREHLEEAYASPAWAIIEANQILVAIGLLLVGMVVGVRAAFRMHRDPHQSTGSIIGWATTMVLIWGGIGLAGAAYMAPGTVYVIAAQGGVDIPAVAALLDQYPAIFLLQVAAVSIIFGSLLAAMRGVARRSKRAAKAVKKEEVRTEKAAKKKEKRAAKKEAKPPVKMSVVQEAPAVDEPNPDANDPEDVDGSDENLDHATDAESSER